MDIMERAKAALAAGLRIKCECRVRVPGRYEQYRQCKRYAVTLNQTGAFVYSCKQHKYVRCD
jgi:hypothetical protein